VSPPRILNPREIAVAGTDSHLPAVPPEFLTPAALRLRFAVGVAWQPEFSGDGRIGPEREPASAAVLVPLVNRGADGLQVLLTRRTDHLRDHAGQVSFPGGRSEPEDGSPAATALREAEEEVGLAPRHVEVIGQMPIYTTVTQFIVTPVVALVQPPFELALDAFEVADAFEVPLAYLMNPAHHRRHVVVYEGGQRQFISIPWQAPGHERDFFIWGATASMLRNLYRFLSA
jgi:8-oxo-dGTP pyrophosphatase MutT (NUDIX family)